MMAKKNGNKKFWKRIQKFFQKNFFFDQKSSKTSILAIFGRKSGKDKNFWSKFFFGGNRFRMVQNVF